MPEISPLEWQYRFGTEEACLEVLIRVRWPDGFICPECAGREHNFITSKKPTSVAIATIKPAWRRGRSFIRPTCRCSSGSGRDLPDCLGQGWYFCSPSQQTSWGVMDNGSTHTAENPLGHGSHRDSIYRLENLIECDDALVGGKRLGGNVAEVPPAKNRFL